MSSTSIRKPLQFDVGDEMYYRIDEDNENKPGLAIIAQNVPPEEFSSAGVAAVCVQD